MSPLSIGNLNVRITQVEAQGGQPQAKSEKQCSQSKDGFVQELMSEIAIASIPTQRLGLSTLEGKSSVKTTVLE